MLTTKRTWTGAVNTTWNNAGNWSSCNNGRNNYPDGNDWVIIPITANQPIINGYEAAYGFASGTGGGTITVNANSSFTVRGIGEWVESSITFQGGAAACSTCRVVSPSSVRNATLRLLQNVHFSGSRYPTIGASGSLIIDGGADPANWPTRYIHDSPTTCQGSAGQPATVNFDGAKIERTSMSFGSYCNVTAFRNVNFVSTPTNLHTINVSNCTGSSFATTWDNLHFTLNGGATAKSPGHYFVQSHANCSGVGPVDIHPNGTGGPGYLPTVINDLGNMFIFH